MRRRWRRVGMAAVLVLAAAASACGGGEEPSKEAEYAEAIAASFQGALAAEDLQVDDESARCLGDEVVRVLGVDAFEEAGLTPDEIRGQTELVIGTVVQPTREQADELANAFFDCVNVGALIADFLKRSAEAEGVDIADEKWDCVGENVQKSQVLRDAFADQLMSGGSVSLDTSDPEIIKEIIGDCLTLEDLLKLGQATSTG